MIAEVRTEQIEKSIRASRFWMSLFPYIGMFILALLLWIPFGFKINGSYEEWILNDISETEHPPFFITPTWTTLALDSSRPLQMFFFAASYALDPDSYLYYNIFQMLFFFGKMVVVYWLVLQFLPNHKLLAFIVGLLFIIYPADIGPFSLRTIHIHNAVLCYLLSVYLLIQFRKQSGSIRWMALFGASLFLIVSLFQYKVALVAAVITPLSLLYFGRPNRDFLLGAGCWYATLVFVGLYTFWANSQSSMPTYEGSIISATTFTADNFKGMFNALLWSSQRQFSGWTHAFEKLSYVSQYGPYLLSGLVVTVGVGGYFLHQQHHEKRSLIIPRWRFSLLFMAGLLLFPIGMAVYLPLPTYRFQEFRIYYLATLGSAVALGLGLYFISRLFARYQEITFLLLALPFVGFALLNAFQMHQKYVNFSLIQQSLLQQIVRQAPQIKPETFILIVDNTTYRGIYNPNIFAYNTVFPMAVHYIYKDRAIDAQYCPPEDSAVLATSCQFGTDALHIKNYLYYSGVYLGITDDLTVPYDRLLLFTYEHDGQLKLLDSEEAATVFKISGYNPQGRIVGTMLPYRAHTLFSCDPALSCYQEKPIEPRSTFDLPDIDDIGFGWQHLEVNTMGDFYRWSFSTISTIDIDLSDSIDLSVDFKVETSSDREILDTLKLSVNGQYIPLTFTSTDPTTRVYSATIPRRVLSGQLPRTQLVFTVDRLASVPNTPIRHSFALYWLRIRPVSK